MTTITPRSRLHGATAARDRMGASLAARVALTAVIVRARPTPTPDAPCLLLQSSSYLLLQSGSRLLTEDSP